MAALAAVALAASAFVPLPVPRFLLQGDVPLGAATARVNARALAVRWGLGELAARDAAITLDGADLAEVSAARLRLDTLPWPGRFLVPRRIEVTGARVRLDPGRLRALSSGAGPGTLPSATVRCRDVELHWTSEGSGAQILRIEELDGTLDPLESSAWARLAGPGALRAQVWTRAEAGFSRWSARLRAEAARWRLPDPLPLGLAELSAEQVQVEVEATGTGASLLAASADLEVLGCSASLSAPPIAARGLALRARGDLRGGLRLDGSAELNRLPLEFQGFAWPEASPSAAIPAGVPSGFALLLRGVSQPFAVDDALVAEARSLDPDLAEVLDALEPRGQARLRFATTWSPPSRPSYLLQADLVDLVAVFRGFPEEDGDRPSFPYPVRGLRGGVVAADGEILAAAAGKMGDGRLEAEAAIGPGGGAAGSLAADIAVADLPLDARVTAAAAGTPQLQEIWRTLAASGGGRASATVTVRRQAGSEDAAVRIAVHGAGAELRPSFLPVPVLAQEFRAIWEPGYARFAGTLQCLGGSATARGEVRATSASAAPLRWLDIAAEDLAPSADERRVLAHILSLPAGADDCTLEGQGKFRLSLRQTTNQGTQVLLQWEGLRSRLSWRDVAAADVRGAGTLALEGSRWCAAAPRVEGSAGGGRIAASAVFPGGPGASPTFFLAGWDLTPAAEWIAAFLGPAAQELRLSGRADLRAQIQPGGGAALLAAAELAPLRLQRAAEAPGEEDALAGHLEVVGPEVRSPLLRFQSAAGSTELRDACLRVEAGAVRASATLAGGEGLRLGPRFAALVSPSAWAAIERIGLSGRVRADGLRVDLERAAGGTLRFEAAGTLELANMALASSPELHGGSGIVEVADFSWKGPDSYQGRMALRGGRGLVEGIPVRSASGEIQVTPAEVTVHRFEAEVLGGAVRSFGNGPGGAPEDALLRLGLTPQAPVAGVLYFDELSLSRMRDELRLGGSLSGRLFGRVEFRSSSSSPLDYTARGSIEVRDGVLGTVPVLATLWKAVDVDPPQFRSGRVDFHVHPERNPGTIRVDRLALEHPVLSVEGEGWIDLDGYLRMKATVRTFSLLGRVPGFRDLFDLLVEHNVFGPMERPEVSQRALQKTVGGAPQRRPFPLWTPRIPQSEWERSPALPASAGAGP